MEEKILKRSGQQIINEQIVKYIEFLKFPGTISILLIINIVLLFFLGVSIFNSTSSKEDKAKKQEEIVDAISPYVVQVCVYDNFDEAKKMLNVLKENGLNAMINKPLNTKDDICPVSKLL